MRFTAMAAVLVGGSQLADAAEKTTVDSLLDQGYSVVSSFMTQIGIGVFLQKSDALVICFLVETRETQEINTLYCKPVR